jgi:UDP-N-acetylmuramyl pentapeptide phosphotransferase/UDP-N-acetylglucosamine-1-phosphate transferase
MQCGIVDLEKLNMQIDMLGSIFLWGLPLSIWFAFASSLAVSILLVLTARWHAGLTHDQAHGVQKLHIYATPRVGGIAVFVGVAVAYFSASDDRATLLGPLWMAGSVAFVFGLLEDVTKRVSVSVRLGATILSGLLGWVITGVALHRLGWPWIDNFLSISGVAVVFTAFAIGGIANAINIIDGLNGLASAMKIIALTTVALIAYAEGDTALAFACLSISAAVLGFFWINWPMGKLFLGDGGSYFGGFALAWSCVLLVERNTSVAPFACLLVCIYPFIEVMFSIYRRHLKLHPPGMPDRQHLHSLVYRRYISTFAPTVKENSVAGILVAMMNVPSAVAAYVFRNSTTYACIASVVFIAGYVMLYRRIIRFAWAPSAELVNRASKS